VGLCTGRGFGKTRACAEWVLQEAMEGRAMRIALIAQNEDKTREVMIDGDSGLVACSPPWFPATYELGRLVWPNGAQAFVFTPERPGDIRGPGVHLSWCTEYVAWPQTKRDEARSNVRLMTRLGYARELWDTTPKARHPIIRELLARAARSPERHRVIRGGTRANVGEPVARSDQGMGRGDGRDAARQEELEGVFRDDAAGALWKQAWIDAHRRPMPMTLKRRTLASIRRSRHARHRRHRHRRVRSRRRRAGVRARQHLEAARVGGVGRHRGRALRRWPLRLPHARAEPRRRLVREQRARARREVRARSRNQRCVSRS
jgi:phage terminase large subunit-like protein